MQPLVSVIVPIYNVEKYLNRCVDSILVQTYKNLEIILVDDGSTDNSGEICDEYSSKYNNITVIHKENQGLTLARKRGIDAAKGEYIAFVDSDDWIEADMIENLINGIKKSNAEIAAIGYFEDYNKNSVPIGQKAENGFYDISTAILLLHRKTAVFPFMWNKLYKKSLLCNVDFSCGNITGEDYYANSQILPKANGIYIVSCCGYHYVQHNNSMSKSIFNDSRKKSFEMYKRLREEMISKYPNNRKEIINYILIEYLAILVSMGRTDNSDANIAECIQTDIRHNLKGFIINDYVGTLFKLSAIISAVSYKLLIFISKMRNTITKR